MMLLTKIYAKNKLNWLTGLDTSSLVRKYCLSLFFTNFNIFKYFLKIIFNIFFLLLELQKTQNKMYKCIEKKKIDNKFKIPGKFARKLEYSLFRRLSLNAHKFQCMDELCYRTSRIF